MPLDEKATQQCDPDPPARYSTLQTVVLLTLSTPVAVLYFITYYCYKYYCCCFIYTCVIAVYILNLYKYILTNRS